MSIARPDITAVLNLHREGPLAHSSLRSILDARLRAEDSGLLVEIVIAIDRPDWRTTSYVASASNHRDIRIVGLDVGDLPTARNVAVAAAQGEFVAFLDGDDLWCENWLTLAHEHAKRSSSSTIWHPEFSLFFGDDFEPYWFKHVDEGLKNGSWTNLALRNPWTSLSFSTRHVYQTVPYRKNSIESGFGYEDWAWNADTIDHGFDHQIVPGTVHLVRMQAQSLVRQTSASNALVTPTNLFKNRLRQT